MAFKHIKKKRVPTKITIVVFVVSAIGTGLLWAMMLRVPVDVGVQIVPGEFPKKITTEVGSAEVDEPPVTQDTAQQIASAISYPVQISATEASSLRVVVNKKHKLPSDYTPVLANVEGSKLRPEAAEALQLMFADARSAGHDIKVISGYRSYSTQVSVYNNYVSQYGRAQADTFSARPGHSEHQTGLAVDVGYANGYCELEICLGQTDFGIWLELNAPSYGFIIRYPEGKEALTGYQYEPWHLRYVGTDLAEAIDASAQTLDQYLNFPAGNY